MSETLLERPDTIIPSAEDARVAEQSSRQLAKLKTKKSLSLRVQTDRQDEHVTIPNSMFRVLLEILTNLAKGNAVTVVPSHAELTTQQAADILNVSRPFVVQLVQSKQLPHRMVGTHRRILFADLMDYKSRVDADRLRTLEELTKQAQDLDMGY